MNLKEIRDMLAETTGRADLQTNTSLANYFINAGLRMLDDKVKAPTMPNVHVVPLPVGMGVVYVKGLRTISSVFFQNEERGMTLLYRKDMVEIISYYGMKFPAPVAGSLPYDSIIFEETGAPAFYSLMNIAPSPEQMSMFREGLETQVPTLGVHYGQEDDTIGLLVYPAPSTSGALVINGYFDRGTLFSDSETNWWTSTYPDLVVEAASYKIEVANRNTEGAQDKLKPLLSALVDVEHQLIDLEIGNVNEMEASK